MFTSDFSLSHKTILTVFIAGVLLSPLSYSYSSDKNDSASLKCEKVLKEEEARFKKATEQAKKHDRRGLITIFEIAAGSKSEHCTFAELSETASSVLTETLVNDTFFWIKSLAGIDYENIKKFIKHGGLASINDDEYIKRKKGLLINLKKYKGNKKEIRLRNLLIEELRATYRWDAER